MRFRRATLEDGPALAALAFRSKAHWGYSPEFMEVVREALDPSDYLEDWPVYVCSVDDRRVGFYGFREIDGEIFLHDMFIAPEWIGKGIGRQLWEHCLYTAREQGWPKFLIESEPYAEPFYLHMGAVRMGEIVSPSTGRRLPLLRVELGER